MKERIDRGLCTLEWSQCYNKASCKHIESIASYHSMLILETQKEKRKRKKRFQFDKRWHKEVENVVKDAWNIPSEGTRWYQVTQKIKNCRIELLKWNSSKKGNSLEKINGCKKKIEDIKALNVDNKKQQMQEAKKQLKAAYDEEEAYRNQKSRLRWLK